MGWMYSYKQADDVKDEIENRSGIFKSSTPGYAYEIVDSAIVGTTYYAAVRYTTPDRPPYVFAAVILFRNPKSGFGYKDMDESVGPGEVACPLRILDKLSPLSEFPGGSDGYAAAWRERVRQYHAQKSKLARAVRVFKPGDRIRLGAPLKFSSGFTADTFTIVQTRTSRGKRRTVFQADNGAMCSFNKAKLADAVIIQVAET